MIIVAWMHDFAVVVLFMTFLQYAARQLTNALKVFTTTSGYELLPLV